MKTKLGTSEAVRGDRFEGATKLHEKRYGHDEAIEYAKGLIANLSPKELAKSFLYSVAHGEPAYRTALACYYYVKNLPEHHFQESFVCTSTSGDHYDKHTCEVCLYDDMFFDVLGKRWFLEFFYARGAIPIGLRFNTAVAFLEEYISLPRPACIPSDYETFKRIIAVIENTPEKTTSAKLRKELKASGLLAMTMDQIKAFIDMLGYLNILHPKDCFGVTVKHITRREMKDPLNLRSDAAYPVNHWTRACGIDYASISALFDGIYD